MEVEQVVGNGATLEAFLQTGRTGRRNALPDILDKEHGKISTASLPCALEKLSCNDQQGNGTTADPSQSPSTEEPKTAPDDVQS